MTKKDYEVIAKVVKTTIDVINTKGRPEKEKELKQLKAIVNVLVQGLCFELKKDNPRFSSDKFIIACGV